MKRYRIHALLLVMALLCTEAAWGLEFKLPDAETFQKGDVVVAINPDRTKQAKKPVIGAPAGTITMDSYAGVSLRGGSGQVLKLSYDQIQQVYFMGADNAAYSQALLQYHQGNYGAALPLFKRASTNVSRIDPTKKQWFLEHCLFYLADCTRLVGRPAASIEIYSSALSANRNGAFFFQIMLGSAKAKAALGQYTPASQEFGLMTNPTGALSFQTKMQLRPDASRFLFDAKVGAVTCEILGLKALPGKSAQMNRLIASVKELETDRTALLAEAKQFAANGNPMAAEWMTETAMSAKSELLSAQATALQYLAQNDDPKYYNDLMALIKEPLLDAVKENDRKTLSTLFMQRADAYYGLMEKESDEKKAMDLAARALFDYLRVTLTYDPSDVDLVRAHYHTGLLFEKLNRKDAQKRALIQYQLASRNQYAKLGGADFKAAQERVKELRKEMAAESAPE